MKLLIMLYGMRRLSPDN